MPPTPSVRVTGIDHVVLVVRDVERSLGWYSQVLGLVPERLAEWRAGQVPFPSVRVTDTMIIDLFPAAPASTPAGSASATIPGRNLDHVCLVIEPTDLDALAQSGVFDVASGPTDHLFGAQGYARSLYVHDPDRNVIELRSYTPSSE